MNNEISPFVAANKLWVLRKVLADYFYAKNLFTKLSLEFHSGQEVSFEKMKKFSELLYTAKEDLHLIFKRLKDPQKGEFESSSKYTPNADEIEFMNNVGLLFHKATVARELKYMHEYYKTDSDDYVQIKNLLENYVEKMDRLFVDGIELVKRLLKDYKDNLVVLLYLVENEKYVMSALGESLESLLERNEGNKNIDKKLVRLGKYCLQSGWPDRAYSIFRRALVFNKMNREAQKYLAPNYME